MVEPDPAGRKSASRQSGVRKKSSQVKNISLESESYTNLKDRYIKKLMSNQKLETLHTPSTLLQVSQSQQLLLPDKYQLYTTRNAPIDQCDKSNSITVNNPHSAAQFTKAKSGRAVRRNEHQPNLDYYSKLHKTSNNITEHVAPTGQAQAATQAEQKATARPELEGPESKLPPRINLLKVACEMANRQAPAPLTGESTANPNSYSNFGNSGNPDSHCSQTAIKFKKLDPGCNAPQRNSQTQSTSQRDISYLRQPGPLSQTHYSADRQNLSQFQSPLLKDEEISNYQKLVHKIK